MLHRPADRPGGSRAQRGGSRYRIVPTGSPRGSRRVGPPSVPCPVRRRCSAAPRPVADDPVLAPPLRRVHRAGRRRSSARRPSARRPGRRRRRSTATSGSGPSTVVDRQLARARTGSSRPGHRRPSAPSRAAARRTRRRRSGRRCRSAGRRLRMTSPTPRRTRSPSKWPNRSLIGLSPSRSSISRQNPRRDRALRSISRSTAAKK